MAAQSLAKSGYMANFKPFSGYFSQIFRDTELQFVLPIIIIKSDGQTQF